MRIRHKIIKWLSCGDMIMMNISVQNTGHIAPKECGSIIISNAEFRLSPQVNGIVMSKDNNVSSKGNIKIMTYGEEVTIDKVTFQDICTVDRAALAQGGRS